MKTSELYKNFSSFSPGTMKEMEKDLYYNIELLDNKRKSLLALNRIKDSTDVIKEIKHLSNQIRYYRRQLKVISGLRKIRDLAVIEGKVSNNIKKVYKNFSEIFW